MHVGWRNADRQRDAMFLDTEMDFDAVDLLAAIKAALEAARCRPAGSLTRQLSACGQRKGAVDDDSTWLGGFTAGQPPDPAQPVKQATPQAKPGPAGEQLYSVPNGMSHSWPIARACMPQKHRHQIAMIALRNAAPVSVGFVPSIAPSSARTSSTKASTSAKASQDADEVFAVLTAVPI
jgi:hypothetical protein